MKYYLIIIGLISFLNLHGQTTSYYLSGSVDVQSENYDFPVIFTHNELADLFLIIYKNGNEYAKEGPTKNDNDIGFSLKKINLHPDDTLQIDCYDADENNMFTLGLNNDDFICSYKFCINGLLETGKYIDTVPSSRNILNISVHPYYMAKIAVLSFTPYTYLEKYELNKTKKGLAWEVKTDSNFTSSLQKPKKGLVKWQESFTANVYDYMAIEFSTHTLKYAEWTSFTLYIKPGIQQVYSRNGIFEVEVTPL